LLSFFYKDMLVSGLSDVDVEADVEADSEAADEQGNIFFNFPKRS